MKSASVLITGATGFIGRALLQQLLMLGAHVTCLVRMNTQQILSNAVSTIVIDAFTEETIMAALKNQTFDYVFHLAAYGVNPDQVDPIEMLHVNVDATIALLAVARHWPLKGFIYTGSCAEYGPVQSTVFADENHPLKPTTLYSASKVAAGIYAKAFSEQCNIPFVWLRLFGVYGPGEAAYRLMPYLIGLLSKKQRVDLSPGEQMRDFLYVDDVVNALITAAISQHTLKQSIYNICSGFPVMIREIALTIAKSMQCDLALLGFCERDYRAGEVMWLVGDNAAFKRDTNWQPQVDFAHGIEKMIQCFSVTH